MPHAVLGLDIGGANLKAAHSAGGAVLRPFELWKSPTDLPQALREIVHALPAADLMAVTMTGELCDCFTDKRAGVHAILDAVAAVAGPRPVRVWQNEGTFVDLAGARTMPLPVAAANWLALATFAGRLAPGGASLILDIGSTTTDLVPLWNGRPVPRGRTDPERLRTGELVYTGVRRTPLCALLGDGHAAEFFATTLDAYLLLGDLPEDAADRRTADGQPATRAAARARVARMICADAETCPPEQTEELARAVRRRQAAMIGRALEAVAQTLPRPPDRIILAGSGEFLACEVLHHPALAGAAPVSLGQELGAEISQAACAHALAILALEQTDHGA
jgi:probable H4MPT-linked C1 transfer pathway protein